MTDMFASSYFLRTYKIEIPHEIYSWSDEDKPFDELSIFWNHFEADPWAHAAADQNDSSIGNFFVGNLDGSLAVVKPVTELPGSLISGGLTQS